MGTNKTTNQNIKNNKKAIKPKLNPLVFIGGFTAGILLTAIICMPTLQKQTKEIIRLRKTCEKYAAEYKLKPTFVVPCNLEAARADLWNEAATALMSNINHVADNKTLEKFNYLMDIYVETKYYELNDINNPLQSEYEREELDHFTEIQQWFRSNTK